MDIIFLNFKSKKNIISASVKSFKREYSVHNLFTKLKLTLC